MHNFSKTLIRCQDINSICNCQHFKILFLLYSRVSTIKKYFIFFSDHGSDPRFIIQDTINTFSIIYDEICDNWRRDSSLKKIHDHDNIRNRKDSTRDIKLSSFIGIFIGDLFNTISADFRRINLFIKSWNFFLLKIKKESKGMFFFFGKSSN